MDKALSLILLAVSFYMQPSAVYAQVMQQGILRTPPASGGVTCTGTDSFTGTGTLSACWTQAASPAILSRVSGSIQLTSGAGGIAVYTGKTVSSTFTITTQSSSFGGPCILMQTNGTGYCWFIQGAELFALLNGGGVSSFGSSCPAVSNGDVVTISETIAVGVPTITCMNVTHGGTGAGSDTNLCSGSPCSITGTAGVLMGPSDVYNSFVGT